MELVKFNQAYRAIMIAKTVDEVKQIRDKAEALRLYLKQQGESLEMQNACAEIKIRAERRAGEILKETPLNGGDRKSEYHDGRVKLSDFGIDHHQSSRFQSIADIPEQEFEAEIAKTKVTKKELTTKQMLKLARDMERKRLEDEAKEKASNLIISPSESYQLITGDLVTECLNLESDSIDAIITDPPYPKEFLFLYGQLAEHAARLLKPGGSLLVMCGQSYLPDIIHSLTLHLNYQWMLSYLTPGGQSPQIWQRKVNTFWKPILWFVKGEYTGKWHGDVIKSDVNDNDKRYHHWGQSESGIARLVEDYSNPGDLILDPFCGGGTTGLVAIQLNRRFIGIDINEQAIKTSQERLSNATS